MKNGPFWSPYCCCRPIFIVGILLLCWVGILPGQCAVFNLQAALASTASVNTIASLGSAPSASSAAQASGDEGWSIFHKDAKSTVSIYYPNFNNAHINDELAEWADLRMRTFVAGVTALGEGKSHYSMDISYSLTQPSPRFASVIFRISTETGGSRPDIGLISFNYDLQTGQSIGYKDIFSDFDGLLTFLSDYASTDLYQRLGRWERGLIKRGTAPNEANFACFSLRADGMEIFFPPYQVASSSLGEQSVVVPLEQLVPYGPDLSVWGRLSGSK